jgi:Bacterial Ig-like domain
MDRRRFSPSTDALDARVLLSTVPLANLHQKTVRIERLGVVLESLQPGRVIPKDVITAIQTDLRDIVGRLSPAAPATLNAADAQFRSTLQNASVSVEAAAGLRATFTNAIQTTGAPQSVIDDLAANTDKLVQLDTNSANPAILAANDYALLLQTVLGVGRPIQTPAAPKLSPTDDSGVKGDHKTTVATPHLVGTYDTDTTIQLLDENYNVLGTAATTTTGAYSVAPVLPLSVGKHTLRVNAIDANGDPSAPSLPINIVIYAPRVRHQATTTITPGGPLGL